MRILQIHQRRAAVRKGYIVSRSGFIIPEYTIGKDASAPDLLLAKERFSRRQKIVEYYYKRLDLIHNRFNETFWEPTRDISKFIAGMLITPVRFYTDYKYNHDQKYKTKVDARDARIDAMEEQRLKEVKEKLKLYVQEDCAKEEAKKPLPVESSTTTK